MFILTDKRETLIKLQGPTVKFTISILRDSLQSPTVESQQISKSPAAAASSSLSPSLSSLDHYHQNDHASILQGLLYRSPFSAPPRRRSPSCLIRGMPEFNLPINQLICQVDVSCLISFLVLVIKALIVFRFLNYSILVSVWNTRCNRKFTIIAMLSAHQLTQKSIA